MLPNNFIVSFTNKRGMWGGSREFSNNLVGFVDPTGHPLRPSLRRNHASGEDSGNVYCVKRGGKLMEAIWSDYLKDYMVAHGDFHVMFSCGFLHEVCYVQ